VTRQFWIALILPAVLCACGGEASSSGGAGGTGGSLACDQLAALDGELGGQCLGGAAACNGDLVCLEAQTTTVGPGIQDHPEGPDYTFEVSDFPGDYCSGALPPSPGAQCSAENSSACAELCGVCVPRFADADICLRGCRADVDTNSTCRDGYQCDLLLDACDTGCSADDDCRVFIDQNNEFAYDTESTFICNPDTKRCENPGSPGAEAGIACTNDQECEARGICLDEETFGFPGGYCSKIRCDIDPCAGDGICANLGLGVPLCGEICEVGSGATPGDPSTYLNNTQGCSEGFTCFWGGTPDDPSGACVPGEFNDVSTNNIGAECSNSSTCYSPFGQGTCGDPDFVCSLVGEAPGTCLTGFGCTVLDCAVPGMPEDVCGADSECVIDSNSGLSLCLAKCSSAEGCLAGAACADFDGDPMTLDSVCLPFCEEDSECRPGEFCNNLAECTPAT